MAEGYRKVFDVSDEQAQEHQDAITRHVEQVRDLERAPSGVERLIDSLTQDRNRLRAENERLREGIRALMRRHRMSDPYLVKNLRAVLAGSRQEDTDDG